MRSVALIRRSSACAVAAKWSLNMRTTSVLIADAEMGVVRVCTDEH